MAKVQPPSKKYPLRKASIQKLARRGGIKRLSASLYNQIRLHFRNFICNIMRDASLYTDHAKNKTITVGRMLRALDRHGIPVYGYGLVGAPEMRDN